MKKLLVALALLMGVCKAPALTVDSTVSDHCVLLQNAQNTVKGTTTAGRTVTVKLGGTQVGSATADSSGNYAVKFNPGAANATGRSLVVSDGSASQTISDVLVGEVWFVAGQSNAFNMMDGDVMTADYKVAYPVWKEQFDCPNVRVVISTPTQSAGGVSDYYQAAPSQPLNWIVCLKSNEANVKKISPLAFFFGKKLSEYKNCPVGIVLVGKGGTPIGYHLTAEGSALAKRYYGGDYGWGDGISKGYNFSDCYTRTDTIAARGAIWAQGETDGKTGGGKYRFLLQALVENWRSRRNEPNFPFLIYGFANYDNEVEAEGDGKWPLVRWEQEKAVADGLITPAAVFHAIDLSGSSQQGYAKAIHPDQKPDLAARALLAARNLVYGENVAYRCPYPTQAYFNSDKSKVYVTFPSSVSLTMTGSYTQIPFRIKNRGVGGWGTSVRPTSVKIGADGHSLEISFDNTKLSLGTSDLSNSIDYCCVAGTEPTTYIYEQLIKDQNGFPMPPFAFNISNAASSGTDTHTHTWGTPTYTWNADNTICTASAKCTQDASHAANQSVNATLTVTKEATTTSTGTGTRTAVFTSPFTTQTKSVTIPVKTDSGSGSGSSDPVVPGDSSAAGVQLWENGPYWATKNVGATSETDGGKFFMWGDTTGYAATASNPPFGLESNSTTTGKSLAELQSGGYVDSNGNLAKSYDAAYMTMGGTWRMPTYTEWQALTKNCTFAWDDSKKVLVVTGKGAYANAQIYLPCPGYWNRNTTTGAVTLGNQNFCSYYFSSTPVSENSNTTQAYAVTVQKGGAYDGQKMIRYNGYCVRAVSTSNPGGGTSGGDTHTHSWGSASYSWSSDYKTCTATRSCSGCSQKDTQSASATYTVVTAATADKDGLGRWTATFASPYATQTKDVTIPKSGSSDPVIPSDGSAGVQLWANGPYWATKNVGASGETDAGKFFMWGDTTGYSSGDSNIPFGDETKSKTSGKSLDQLKSGGYVDANGNLATAYDAAAMTMGGTWRMPTYAEWEALTKNCTFAWDSAKKVLVVTGKDAYSNAQIYLPCPGYWNTTAVPPVLFNQNVCSYYFSSTPDSANLQKARGVTVQQGGTYAGQSILRYSGYCVRAVSSTDPGSSSGGEGGGTVDPNPGSGEVVEPGDGDHTHTWQVSYTWSTDNTTCKASAVCKGDASHTASRMVSTTYAVVTAPTTSATGKGRFTATFTDSPFSTQTKDVTLAKLEDVTPGAGGGTGGTTAGHEAVQLWANGPYWATMNVGAASETAAGYYLLNNVPSGECFQVQNGALKGSLVSVGSNKLWGSPWRMPTTAEAQTMQSKCKVSAVGTDSNGQPYVVISGNTTGYTDKSIKIPLAGYGNGKTVSDGNRWGTYGKYWTSNSGIAQRLCFYSPGDVSSSKIEMANGGDVGHGNYYTVRMVTDTAPTGGSTGSHTHSWGTASYAWSSDYSTCTASATCSGDTSHVMKKTVAATYTVVTAPTTSATGKGRWTATFSDAPFSTQTKDVTIAKLDAATNSDSDSGSGSGSGSGTGSDSGSGSGSDSGSGTGPETGPAYTSGDWYVSPTGSDSNNGTSKSTPFQTITKAVSSASAGQKICLLKGTYNVVNASPYTDSAAIVLNKGVVIFGETGNPADVVVHNTKEWADNANYNQTYRVFLLNHADAVVSGITIENGFVRGGQTEPKFYGGNVLISSNGGTVENCVIRNGRIDTYQNATADPNTAGAGAAIACISANGLISHCVISNNLGSMGRTHSTKKNVEGSTIVWLKPGTLRQSLIVNNTIRQSWWGSIVHLGSAGALAENCTIANNRYDASTVGNPGSWADSGELYPVNITLNAYDTGAAEGIVRNCVIVNNSGHSGRELSAFSRYLDSTYGNTKKGVAKNNIINCATDCTLPSEATAVTSGFALGADFRPQAGSTLIDAGATMASPVDTDLAGYSRIQGSAVDIGCYEYGSSAPTPQPPSHTHAWGTPTYFWSTDGKSCTATRACSGCTEKETETVTATFVTTKESTTTATGLGHYEATFTNAAFANQSGADITIPKKADDNPPSVTPGADADVVQLWENGPYWAKTNLGTDSESGTGDFYMWGGTVGYAKNGTTWVGTDGSSSANPFGNSIGKGKTLSTLKSSGIVDADGNLEMAYDAANAALGGDWRLPTKEEIKVLQEKCTATAKTVNGVKGIELRGTGSFEGNAIFLPCPGYVEASSGAVQNTNNQTYYLTATAADNDSQFSTLYTTTSAFGRMNVNRNNGYQIRPVRDTAPSQGGASADWDNPGTAIAADTTVATAWPILAESPLANANAAKFQSWVKNVGKVAFENAGSINAEAFLLNCANTDAAIKSAKKEFAFTAIDPANPPAAADFAKKGYNGVVRIEGLKNLSGDSWGPVESGDKFFRAVLTLE